MSPTWESDRQTCHMEGPGSVCWIHNCLLSFNLFISISSPKLICFSSRAIDNGVHSYPGNVFFPLDGYKYLHAIVLGMLYANRGQSPKAH